MSVRKILPGFCFAFLIAVTPTSADTIFASFGPGNSFDGSKGFSFGLELGQEGDPDRYFSQAQPFVAQATARLTSLELALDFFRWHPAGVGSDTLEINLFSADGTMPGELLETFSYSLSHTVADGGLLVFMSSVRPLLVSGLTYFLEPTTTGSADGVWWFAPGSVTRPFIYRVNRGDWQMQATTDGNAAFRVSGDAAPVPEPASMILIGTGLALGAIRRRRASRMM